MSSMEAAVIANQATAEAEQAEVEEYVEVEIRGRKCKAYKPAEGQLVMFLASSGRGQTMDDAIAGVINFFTELFDEDDKVYIEDLLLKRRGGLLVKDVEDKLTELVEKWSANPTQSPSGSPQLPTTGGQNSPQVSSQSIF